MGVPERSGSAVVYVVAKAPRAGQSKTRLCPPLTHAQAANLAAAFLADTISLARRAGVEVRLICRDEDERAALLRYADAATVHVQRAQGLGDALESAFSEGLRDGYAAVGVLGMDVPSLPPSVLAEAFARLGDADVVMGPSADGGYYLLTARRLHPTLFREMTWSTDGVAAETRRRCTALGLRVEEVAEWDDIDDAAALRRLAHALSATDGDVAPHTRAALVELEAALR